MRMTLQTANLIRVGGIPVILVGALICLGSQDNPWVIAGGVVVGLIGLTMANLALK